MGAEDTVQALTAAIGGRLDAIERTESSHHAAVLKRLDAISLNGDAPALRQLAKATPDLLLVASHAAALDRIAKDDEDSRAGWRWLRARLHWDQGVGPALKAIAVAAIGALTLYAAAHLFNSSPPQLPASLPTVTAPPSHAPTFTPLPTVTP